MQAELRYCIYEDQFMKKDKIIILFKSCLLALKNFKLKRIFSLNEIKRILMNTCKPQAAEAPDGNPEQPQQYDEQTREMVYIGMKIIHRAIHKDQDNKKEILTMNGVEIMADIMNYILDNSFNAVDQ